MTDLQLIDAVLNASSVRKVVENGREYFVAPISLIVPGVLAGSKGSLYYPESEVKKNPGIWNNVPIVVYHPTDPVTNLPLSAKEPGVIARSGIGVLRNDRWENGKRVADGYIDAERVKKVDRRVYDVLSRNGTMETSTGLYTKNLQALRNSHYNGRQYHSIATEYRTDHLAILPDQVGACSLNDGCGLNVNTRNNTLSIIDEILNANPEGCNQHTGPGCGGGGGEKESGKGGGYTKGATGKELDNNILRYIEEHGSLSSSVGGVTSEKSFLEIRKDLGHEKFNGHDPLKNPIHKAVVELIKSGHLERKEVGRSTTITRTDKPLTENQGRHLESGQFLNKTGAGVKQTTTAAKKGFHDIDGEQHTEEIDEVLDEIDDEVIEEVTNLRGDTMQLRSDQREAAVTYLVTNCDCWKGKEKVVNSFDDDTLIDIVRDVRNKHEDTIIANSVKSGVKIGDAIVRYDPETKTLNACGMEGEEVAMTKKTAAEVADEEDRTPAELMNPKKKIAPSRTTTPTVEKVSNVMTDEQFNQLCINQFGQPAYIVKAGMDTVMQLEQNKRENLVKRLVANVHNDERKKVLATNLLKEPTGKLEQMVELLPPMQQTRNRQDEQPNLNFLGIGGGPPSGGRVDNAADDTLELPVLNWQDMECVSPAFRKKN